MNAITRMTLDHCISQCQEQSKEQLDPEFSKFMDDCAAYLKELESVKSQKPLFYTSVSSMFLLMDNRGERLCLEASTTKKPETRADFPLDVEVFASPCASIPSDIDLISDRTILKVARAFLRRVLPKPITNQHSNANADHIMPDSDDAKTDNALVLITAMRTALLWVGMDMVTKAD